MIFSPRVVFRTDKSDWDAPIEVEIVTSSAANTGVVRRSLRQRRSKDEGELDAATKDHMARVLYLFEQHGVRNIVLGSFGKGVFWNRIDLVAEIWKELLVGKNACFARSFDRVVFAVRDHETFLTFRRTFSQDGGVRRQDGM